MLLKFIETGQFCQVGAYVLLTIIIRLLAFILRYWSGLSGQILVEFSILHHFLCLLDNPIPFSLRCQKFSPVMGCFLVHPVDCKSYVLYRISGINLCLAYMRARLSVCLSSYSVSVVCLSVVICWYYLWRLINWLIAMSTSQSPPTARQRGVSVTCSSDVAKTVAVLDLNSLQGRYNFG